MSSTLAFEQGPPRDAVLDAVLRRDLVAFVQKAFGTVNP